VNFFLSYIHPLKYYFNRYKINSIKKIEKELQAMSLKWSIKVLDDNAENNTKTDKLKDDNNLTNNNKFNQTNTSNKWKKTKK